MIQQQTDAALLDIRGVSKSYGGVHALRGVDLSIRRGEVHALCGENGAGKSTLIKIISGSVVPDEGSVSLEGRPLALGDVHASEAAGVAVIHQESTAFLHLNAQDNIFAGHEPARARGLLLDRAEMRERTRALIEKLGEHFDTEAPLSGLSVAQRQMVAIARALSKKCRLLIMDEPTASLSHRETGVLFDLIRQLKSGGVSVLYISHRMEEIFSLSDRVTILRDGRWIATQPVARVTPESLIQLMVGRAVEGRLPSGKPVAADQAPLLEVQGLSREHEFSGVSFSVRAGEILGLAGLVGAGRTEVAHCLFGITAPDRGRVKVAGAGLSPGSARAAMEAGVALVPEDRQHSGLALPMSVSANISLPILKALSRFGLLSGAREKSVSLRYLKELSIRAESVSSPANTLSGGNQQKVVVGKWLATSPRVLILDEPTRGVDVGAKAEIHGLIRRLADQGMAVLVVTSELPELLTLSDRILVMREGTISGQLSRAEATQEKVLTLALPESDKKGAPERSAETAGPGAVAGPLKRFSERREFWILSLLLFTILLVTWKNPAFLATGNIRDMLLNCVPAAIVACGVMLVVVTAEIDISVGSLMGLLAMGIFVAPSHLGLPVPAGVLLTLLLGAAIGGLTGALVAFGRVPSVIVTLGMLTILRGTTQLLMAGDWIIDLPPGLRYFGTGRLLGVPVPLWAAGSVIALTFLLVRQTPLGRRIFALGSNPSSARLAGIPEKRVKLFVFALTGLLTAVAAVFSVPRISVIDSGIGTGLEMLVLTCVVVGGTSISGGRGTLPGVILAVLLLGIVRTVLIYMKLGEMATYWERAIQGAFILAAVLADHLARRRRAVAGAA